MENNRKSGVSPYRVLSLDGGGMRGLYAASLLKELSDRFNQSAPKDIGKGFDLIVGTSTGGIIAAGLAAGVDINNLIKIYAEEGRHIFTNPIPKGKIRILTWIFRHFCKSANSNEKLKIELQKILKKETVGELFNRRKIGLCLTAINLSNGRPRVFKTPHDPERCADDNRTLADVCLATSAAPIVFPIAVIEEPNNSDLKEGFIDGGLWANNPVLIGLIESLRLSKREQAIEVISVGTCPPPGGPQFDDKNTNKGVKYWRAGVRSLDMSMNAQSEGFNFMCGFLANSLKNLDKQVTICRLNVNSLSKEQIDKIGLDVATKEACDILRRTGITDGQQIYSKILKYPNNEEFKILKDIFTNLPHPSK